MSKKYNRMHKTFASVGEPLYDKKEDFLYYFEKRLKTLVREEIEVMYRNTFWGAPF